MKIYNIAFGWELFFNPEANSPVYDTAPVSDTYRHVYL